MSRRVVLLAGLLLSASLTQATENKALTQAAEAAADGDWSEARSLYKKIADQAKKNGHKDDRRAALEGLVKALTQLQDYAGALAAEKELAGLDAGGQRQLDAAVLAVYAHELDQAVKLLNQADRSFEKSHDADGRGKVAYYRAIVYQRQSKYAEELTAYGRSRAFYQEAGNANEAARRLLDIANVYKELVPDFAKAQAAYEGAIAELDLLHDSRGVLDVQIDEGNLFIVSGRTEEAVALLSRARANIPREEARPWLHVTQILANAHYRRGGYDMARGLLAEGRGALALLPTDASRAPYSVDIDNLSALIAAELGDTDEAVKGFEVALAQATKFDLKAKQSIVLNNLGYWLREAGRYDQAIGRLQQALALDQSLKTDEGVAYDQRNLGLALIAAGRTAEAQDAFESALATSTQLGLAHNAAWCYVGQATAALAGGDTKTAEATFRKGYEAAAAATLPDLQWRAAVGLARALLKDGQTDEAFGAFETALVAIDSLEESLGSDAARRGFKTRLGVAQVYKDYAAALVAANRGAEAERVRRRAAPRPVEHITKPSR